MKTKLAIWKKNNLNVKYVVRNNKVIESPNQPFHYDAQGWIKKNVSQRFKIFLKIKNYLLSLVLMIISFLLLIITIISNHLKNDYTYIRSVLNKTKASSTCFCNNLNPSKN